MKECGWQKLNLKTTHHHHHVSVDQSATRMFALPVKRSHVEVSTLQEISYARGVNGNPAYLEDTEPTIDTISTTFVSSSVLYYYNDE
jgi:hypothetical protein